MCVSVGGGGFRNAAVLDRPLYPRKSELQPWLCAAVVQFLAPWHPLLLFLKEQFTFPACKTMLPSNVSSGNQEQRKQL